MSFLRVADTRLMQLDPSSANVAVKEGAQNVAYIPLVSASLSTSNCTFNLNNIATEVCRNRKELMRLTGVVFTLNVSQTATQAIFSYLGFKPWPLNSCIANIQHQIGQASYSLNLSQIMDAITKFNLESENANFYDNTSYDAVSSYIGAAGTALNPIQPFTSTPLGWGVFKPRSANITLSTNVSTGSNQTITITCNLYEPLCSPFNNVGKDDDHSLYGINGEILQLQFVSDIFSNMIAAVLNTGTTINSVSVAFPSTATLECIYLTPNQEIARNLPKHSISHYNQYSVFSLDTGAVTAGSTLSVTSPVCQITNLPFKILVYCRQSDATKTALIPSRYLQIQNVQNCQLDNGSNQLSSASIDQLYEISVRNGCVLDRLVWKQQLLSGLDAVAASGVGSILALDPKIDLGCRQDISDGSPGRYIFQITLSLKNNTADNFAGTTLYIVAINNAILERNGSEYRNYLYSLPDNAINTSRNMNAIEHHEFSRAQNANMFMSGGDFKSLFNKVWKGAKDAGKWAWQNRDQIKDTATKAYDIGKKTYDIGKKFGLGNEDLGSNIGESFTLGRHPRRQMDLFYQ
ncbi:MAG: hypothetical protein KGZ34_04450 [Nitrosarchaeum sp.]|nr:hypothetical protein [Nitrosarchaeum sp.]